MEFTTQLELQSQTTRLIEKGCPLTSRHERGYHPPRRAIQCYFIEIYTCILLSTDYNSEDSQSELFPLHSPLLGKSWLVSFPPLSYMLKFSGYSCLIGGPMRSFQYAFSGISFHTCALMTNKASKVTETYDSQDGLRPD
jgi:hypothetical protein